MYRACRQNCENMFSVELQQMVCEAVDAMCSVTCSRHVPDVFVALVCADASDSVVATR